MARSPLRDKSLRALLATSPVVTGVGGVPCFPVGLMRPPVGPDFNMASMQHAHARLQNHVNMIQAAHNNNMVGAPGLDMGSYYGAETPIIIQPTTEALDMREHGKPERDPAGDLVIDLSDGNHQEIPPEEMPPKRPGGNTGMRFASVPTMQLIRERVDWVNMDSVSLPTVLREQDMKYVAVVVIDCMLCPTLPPGPLVTELRQNVLKHCTYMTLEESRLLNRLVTHNPRLTQVAHHKFSLKDLLVPLSELLQQYALLRQCSASMGQQAPESHGVPSSPSSVSMSPPVSSHMLPPVMVQETRFSVPRAKTVDPEMSGTTICGVEGGWVQVNNTVVPFCIRNRVKLVPLAVIRFAAGLLEDIEVDGLIVTANECEYLNRRCSTAGLGFNFPPNAKLIELFLVPTLCKHRMNITELPNENPFRHARMCSMRPDRRSVYVAAATRSRPRKRSMGGPPPDSPNPKSPRARAPPQFPAIQMQSPNLQQISPPTQFVFPGPSTFPSSSGEAPYETEASQKEDVTPIPSSFGIPGTGQKHSPPHHQEQAKSPRGSDLLPNGASTTWLQELPHTLPDVVAQDNERLESVTSVDSSDLRESPPVSTETREVLL